MKVIVEQREPIDDGFEVAVFCARCRAYMKTVDDLCLVFALFQSEHECGDE